MDAASNIVDTVMFAKQKARITAGFFVAIEVILCARN
jgi:hypothetical protein